MTYAIRGWRARREPGPAGWVHVSRIRRIRRSNWAPGAVVSLARSPGMLARAAKRCHTRPHPGSDAAWGEGQLYFSPVSGCPAGRSRRWRRWAGLDE